MRAAAGIAVFARFVGVRAETFMHAREEMALGVRLPATTEKRHERTSIAAANMAISGGRAFPLIVGWFTDFLISSEHVDQLIWSLAQLYPQAALFEARP
jgi:hypothetical protein